MTTVKHNGRAVKITDRDYSEVFVDCEGHCEVCFFEGGCDLQSKLDRQERPVVDRIMASA